MKNHPPPPHLEAEAVFPPHLLGVVVAGVGGGVRQLRQRGAEVRARAVPRSRRVRLRVVQLCRNTTVMPSHFAIFSKSKTCIRYLIYDIFYMNDT